MLLSIDQILSPEDLSHCREVLEQAEFVDGTLTAGWHARLVKANTQLKREDPCYQSLQQLVVTALQRHSLFQMAVYPAAIHSLRFSRYEVGMSYGSHVDNALMMDAGRRYRSDVSWTLFLNEPDSYGGGELVIEAAEGEQSYKLSAGSMVLYPSRDLHHVEPVTQGVRLAVVGWVQSLIRDSQQRSLLFDLDVVRRSLFEKQGKTLEFDLISKSHSNLLRQWAEL
jgi:PKHD-type hydroxylase